MFGKQGKTHSEILREQTQSGAGLLGGPLRFPTDQLAILWVQCDQKVLDKRCDSRVDTMIENGLLSELQDFHKVKISLISKRIFRKFLHFRITMKNAAMKRRTTLLAFFNRLASRSSTITSPSIVKASNPKLGRPSSRKARRR